MSAVGYPSICQTVRFDGVARVGPAAADRIAWVVPRMPDIGVRVRRIVFADGPGDRAKYCKPVTRVTV